MFALFDHLCVVAALISLHLAFDLVFVWQQEFFLETVWIWIVVHCCFLRTLSQPCSPTLFAASVHIGGQAQSNLSFNENTNLRIRWVYGKKSTSCRNTTYILHLISTVIRQNVTVFGKNGLNEICVWMHFNAFWMHYNAFQRSPTIRNALTTFPIAH